MLLSCVDFVCRHSELQPFEVVQKFSPCRLCEFPLSFPYDKTSRMQTFIGRYNCFVCVRFYDGKRYHYYKSDSDFALIR